MHAYHVAQGRRDATCEYPVIVNGTSACLRWRVGRILFGACIITSANNRLPVEIRVDLPASRLARDASKKSESVY